MSPSLRTAHLIATLLFYLLPDDKVKIELRGPKEVRAGQEVTGELWIYNGGC